MVIKGMRPVININISMAVAELVSLKPGDELPEIGNFPALAAQMILNCRGLRLGTDQRGNLIAETIPQNELQKRGIS